MHRRSLAATARTEPARSLERLLDLIEFPCLLLDLADGRILAANPSAAALYERSSSELQKMSLHDLSADGLQHRCTPLSVKALHAQHTHITKSGSEIHVHIKRLPIRTDNKRWIVAGVETTRVRSHHAGVAQQQSAPPLIALCSPSSSRLLAVNQEFAAALGRAPKDLIAQSAVGLGLWPDLRAFRRMVRQLNSGQALKEAEITFTSKDAVRRSEWLSADIIKVQGKSLVLLTLTDNTQQQAQAHTLRSQATVLDAINQAVVIMRPDGTTEFCNRRAEQLFGWPEKEMVGRNIHELIGGGTSHPIAQALLHSTLMNGTWDGSSKVRHRDGTVIPVQISAATIMGDALTPSAIITIMTDVSEQQRTERELRDGLEWYRELFEKSADPISLFDSQGSIISRNPAGVAAVGGPEVDQNGRIVEFKQVIDERVRANLLRALEKGSNIFEWTAGDAPNGPRHFEVNARQFRYQGKQAILAISRDVTLRRNIERQLRTSLQEKDLLLQEVHHRVKNNLQIIASLLSIGRRRIQDPAAADMLEHSRYRIDLMASVYEQVYQSKDLTRIDFSEFLRQSTRSVLEAYWGSTAQISFRTDLAPLSLPLQPALYLAIAVHELVVNAVKHAFGGRETGEIHLSLAVNPEGMIQLCVADDGVGMPTEPEPRSGVSLGLRLVEMLVHQLQGSVKKLPASGTHYCLSIPVPSITDNDPHTPFGG
jgi:PAS domain S-box-containing protein